MLLVHQNVNKLIYAPGLLFTDRNDYHQEYIFQITLQLNKTVFHYKISYAAGRLQRGPKIDLENLPYPELPFLTSYCFC